MASSLARGAHNATNSLHSLIYFVPETEQQLTSVGLRAGRMCYFAGRLCPYLDQGRSGGFAGSRKPRFFSPAVQRVARAALPVPRTRR
jgi:hypothetical protein